MWAGGDLEYFPDPLVHRMKRFLFSIFFSMRFLLDWYPVDGVETMVDRRRVGGVAQVETGSATIAARSDGRVPLRARSY